MKFKSYVLTIHLGERDSDLQSPSTLQVSLGWFKAGAGVTIKYWVSNILQLLKFCQYYCFIMVLIMHGGGPPQSSSQVISVPAYIRKKALNLERKIGWIIWNLVFNMECGIYVGKVGWNIWDSEKEVMLIFVICRKQGGKCKGLKRLEIVLNFLGVGVVKQKTVWL